MTVFTQPAGRRFHEQVDRSHQKPRRQRWSPCPARGGFGLRVNAFAPASFLQGFVHPVRGGLNAMGSGGCRCRRWAVLGWCAPPTANIRYLPVGLCGLLFRMGFRPGKNMSLCGFMAVRRYHAAGGSASSEYLPSSGSTSGTVAGRLHQNEPILNTAAASTVSRYPESPRQRAIKVPRKTRSHAAAHVVSLHLPASANAYGHHQAVIQALRRVNISVLQPEPSTGSAYLRPERHKSGISAYCHPTRRSAESGWFQAFQDPPHRSRICVPQTTLPG